MSNTFVFAFSNQGFESIINLTEIDEKYIQAKLADQPLPQSVNSLIHYLDIRARFNSERQMEVWALGVEDGLTEDDLWNWAKSMPQTLANELRKRGHNIYGKHYHRDTVIS